MNQSQKKEFSPPKSAFSSSDSTSGQPNKAFSFQNQNSFSQQDNKENLNSSFKNDYAFFLESTKDKNLIVSDKNLILSEKSMNITSETNKYSREINEIDQLLENKNLILKKLKYTKPNSQEKEEENELFSERIPTQKIVKCSSTIKKQNNYQENNLNGLDFYGQIKENNEYMNYTSKNEKDLVFQLKANSKLVDDYRKQIDLLEKNFANQKNQQTEIIEYRRLINNFEEKINLLIDDNQRLVNLVEVTREELSNFKENSDEMLRKYQEKVSNLEKDNKFKEDRYNEAILCLDSYKVEIDRLKGYKALNEKERVKLLEESKRISLKLLEFEKNEETYKNCKEVLSVKIENLKSEDKEIKSKKEILEINMKELLKKNQFLNKDLNERIAELNKVKKENELCTKEKQIDNEKFLGEISKMRQKSEDFKEVKENEIKGFVNELNEIKEKHHSKEKTIVRYEEIIKGLENSMRKYEKEREENEKITQENENFLKENEKIRKEKEEIMKNLSKIHNKNQELMSINQNLSNSLKETANEYQMKFENYNKSAQTTRVFEINEISNHSQKQILEKTRLINEIMLKNKAFYKEIEMLQVEKEQYKQKLTKMDLNYGKAIQELKFAYEQEKNMKTKNFQYQIAEINKILNEKEKLLNSFSKEKENLLIILKKTTDGLNKKCCNEEKSNENDLVRREMVLKGRMRNHSAEREYEGERKPRLSLEYRRSFHLLKENENLNNEIFKNCMYLY